ncbi:hypothetical protein L596_017135 [Steinernema carpocapsae]|uniref:Uncharacterized protein n=1 Tax=Steinernema carpocapsae TaxID=34508 RepID=A0A4U5N144_STECR|nr:hypothetical protein L596_017135 [Steinernema carpocapsae]
MSWYSRIYVFVRQYREKHPFLGFFLHISLYALLAFQFVGAIFSIYVYNWVFLRIFVRNAIQRTIYGVVYNYLMFMFFWSIGQTIITKVARVPKQYYVTPEVDKQMKEATPFLKGRYEPDASSQEKAHEQYNLLVEAAESARLRVIEALKIWSWRGQKLGDSRPKINCVGSPCGCLNVKQGTRILASNETVQAESAYSERAGWPRNDVGFGLI